jgi:hypothetical protein
MTLPADGKFKFSDVPFQSGQMYVTTTEFQGLTYGSQIVNVDEQTASLDLPIQIYETTADTSQLSIDRLHLFLDATDEKTLRIVELYVISNKSNKTVASVDDVSPLLKFQIPTGATNLEFEEGVLGERYIPTEDGFGDLAPISPSRGEHQVIFTYLMPYDRKLELNHSVPLTTDAIVVLMPVDGLKIKSDGLQDAGKRDIQGVQYQMYSAPGREAGQPLGITISGNPSSRSAVQPDGNRTGLVIGLASLGLALVIGGVWIYLRSRPAVGDEKIEADATREAEQAAPSAETLMDAILTLDDLYKEGKLPEPAYRQRRAELKDQLSKALEK